MRITDFTVTVFRMSLYMVMFYYKMRVRPGRFIMMLMSRTEFTEDGCMNTLMRVPEDKIELAKSQGAVIDEDGFAAIEQTTWKEKDGKFYYDTKVKGEVLGETVDPFAEIPVDENGCLTIAYGTMILERI